MAQAQLNGSVALVTGASSGIGAATAESLAGLGATVALAARRADRLEELATRIRDAGGTALVVEADVTGREAAEQAVARTVDELGGLDIVINNAGVMLLGPMADAPVEEWERMVQLNVMGAMYVAKAALPHLLEAAENGPRGVADLVNISSVAGRVVRSGSGVYNASKHALGAFSEGVRQEFTARGLRSSLVEPGATATELAGHNREEVQVGLRQRFSGMTRLEAQDIADVITFVVTRPRHVAVNEVLVRPTDQEQ
jgi:NADP-dependent 3-hydroxy acid dehydrogenase YdfG